MAPIPPVTCPNCEKKFRPKSEVTGKKIKCPFCKEPFEVRAAKAEASARAKADTKGKPEEAVAAGEPPAVAAAPEPPRSEFDADGNPYGVTNQDLRKRCPNCANEMQSENSIICLKCGYNTLTREVGKSETVLALTFKQRIIYLLPALGAAAFTICLIIFQIFYAVVSPSLVQDSMFSFTDAEAMRMWSTVIYLALIWMAGTFCFKKFIEKPRPDEIKTSG